MPVSSMQPPKTKRPGNPPVSGRPSSLDRWRRPAAHGAVLVSLVVVAVVAGIGAPGVVFGAGCWTLGRMAGWLDGVDECLALVEASRKALERVQLCQGRLIPGGTAYALGAAKTRQQMGKKNGRPMIDRPAGK